MQIFDSSESETVPYLEPVIGEDIFEQINLSAFTHSLQIVFNGGISHHRAFLNPDSTLTVEAWKDDEKLVEIEVPVYHWRWKNRHQQDYRTNRDIVDEISIADADASLWKLECEHWNIDSEDVKAFLRNDGSVMLEAWKNDAKVSEQVVFPGRWYWSSAGWDLAS